MTYIYFLTIKNYASDVSVTIFIDELRIIYSFNAPICKIHFYSDFYNTLITISRRGYSYYGYLVFRMISFSGSHVGVSHAFPSLSYDMEGVSIFLPIFHIFCAISIHF